MAIKLPINTFLIHRNLKCILLVGEECNVNIRVEHNMLYEFFETTPKAINNARVDIASIK